jgi:predicted DNA-binding WGR domain protein
MSSGDLALARVVLKTLNPVGAAAAGRDAAEDAVVSALAAALRERGFEVELAVGHSHFRCDLAVKRPADAAFALAVFVDTEGYYREHDSIERDVLRPKLLRAFGWDVAHVLAKDWYEDAAGVVKRLEQRLRGEATEVVEVPAGEVEPLSDKDVWLETGKPPTATPPPSPPSPSPEPPPTAPPPTTPPSPAAPVRISALLPGQTRYFEFIGGTSRKFWHVTVDGGELVVSFGRIGTAGQLKRKSFPTEAMARREAEALIREKLGKGYQEVSPT